MSNLPEVGIKLRDVLMELYDDRNLTLCVIVVSENETNWRRILDYINDEHEKGNAPSAVEVQLLALNLGLDHPS